MTACPKCLGTGEVFTHNKLRICNLCDGNKKVPNELAEDFISSIHPFKDD